MLLKYCPFISRNNYMLCLRDHYSLYHTFQMLQDALMLFTSSVQTVDDI